MHIQHTRIYTHMHAHAYTHAYASVQALTQSSARTHTHTHTHVHTYTRTHTYAHDAGTKRTQVLTQTLHPLTSKHCGMLNATPGLTHTQHTHNTQHTTQTHTMVMLNQGVKSATLPLCCTCLGASVLCPHLHMMKLNGIKNAVML
jgi:hypothetical protein